MMTFFKDSLGYIKKEIEKETYHYREIYTVTIINICDRKQVYLKIVKEIVHLLVHLDEKINWYGFGKSDASVLDFR